MKRVHQSIHGVSIGIIGQAKEKKEHKKNMVIQLTTILPVMTMDLARSLQLHVIAFDLFICH